MSKLLNRAKVDIENAKHNLERISHDDVHLDAGCFQVQQAIEKTIKFIVEIHGGNYVQNHDIRANINKLDEMNRPLPEDLKSVLRSKAAQLAAWEATTRYGEDFYSDAQELTEMIALAEKTVEVAESLVQELETIREGDEVFTLEEPSENKDDHDER